MYYFKNLLILILKDLVKFFIAKYQLNIKKACWKLKLKILKIQLHKRKLILK